MIDIPSEDDFSDWNDRFMRVIEDFDYDGDVDRFRKRLRELGCDDYEISDYLRMEPL
jgi:hypothetical protein